jgi:hypothetical protein
LAAAGLRSRDETKGEGEDLRETGHSAREESVGRSQSVGGELDLDTEAEEAALARMVLLVRHPARVVGPNFGAIGKVTATEGPHRRDEERAVVEADMRADYRVQTLSATDT